MLPSDPLSAPKIGIGLDSCVIPLRHKDLSLIQSTDFFYPIIDDPFVMGRITCANVLSDVYAMGVQEIDKLHMILGVPFNMEKEEFEVIFPLIMEGFKSAALEAHVPVSGGDTRINPWCLLGGVATTICTPEEFILPDKAQPGDLLVLTKPLGVQLAVVAYSCLGDRHKRKKLLTSMNELDVRRMYKQAVKSMSRLNRIAACLMHKYNAHGATDVTGYGILGHAENLVKYQMNEVSFTIYNLPVFCKVPAVAKKLRYTRLIEGRAPETSGGLLVVLPANTAELYCQALEEIEGYKGWIVGNVKSGSKTAKLAAQCRFVEVPYKEIDEQF